MTGLLVAFGAGLATTVVGLLGVRRRWLVVTVDGVSMEPTLRPGDRVLVRRLPRSRLRVGQVVVLRGRDPWRPAEHAWVIKRLAALPGDPLPPGLPAGTDSADSRVPVDRVVLLGDNSGHSADSRQRGYYRLDDVVGAVRRQLRRTA